MIETEAKAFAKRVLHRPHLGAVLLDRLARLGGGKLRRGAMLVRCAQKQHLVAARAHVAGMEIGRQLAANQVSQMLDPVDVGDRRSDQDACLGLGHVFGVLACALGPV